MSCAVRCMIRIDVKAPRDLIGRIGLKLCGKPRVAHCMFLSSDSYTVLFHCAAPPRPACGKAQRDPVRPQPFLYCYSLQPFGHRRPSWAIAHTCTASRERNGCFHDAVKRCSATAWDGRAAPPSEPTARGRCRCAMRRAASSLQVRPDRIRIRARCTIVCDTEARSGWKSSRRS